MGKVAKAHVEGCSQAERKKRRAELGSLQSLTVQPKTRVRYEKALEQFWAFLRHEGLAFPRGTHELDRLLSVYVEHLWSEGYGRALAADTVAGVQDAQPNVRKQLPSTWRLLKAWNVNEIPSRTPPLPEEALQTMVGYAIFKKEIPVCHLTPRGLLWSPANGRVVRFDFRWHLCFLGAWTSCDRFRLHQRRTTAGCCRKRESYVGTGHSVASPLDFGCVTPNTVMLEGSSVEENV